MFGKKCSVKMKQKSLMGLKPMYNRLPKDFINTAN